MATRWELHDGAAQTGPLDEDHVVRMIGAGLPATTMVRPEGREKWKPVGSHMPFAEAMARAVPAAPSWGPPPQWAQVPVPVQAQQQARIVAGSGSFVGGGCLVQGLGLFAPVVGFLLGGGVGAAIGLVVLLALLLVGRQMATTWKCGACANPVASRDVRACSACRATLAP